MNPGSGVHASRNTYLALSREWTLQVAGIKETCDSRCHEGAENGAEAGGDDWLPRQAECGG
jgi:hypothetical protein